MSENHAFLKAIRNDLGGRFLPSVAEHVLDELHPDAVGVIELYKRGKGADIKFKFAMDLVAIALIKNREAGQNSPRGSRRS